MHPTLKRMVNEARPAEEISLAADGLAFRWLLENSTIQPDDRGEWALVYIQTEQIPITRSQAIDAIRAASGDK